MANRFSLDRALSFSERDRFWVAFQPPTESELVLPDERALRFSFCAKAPCQCGEHAARERAGDKLKIGPGENVQQEGEKFHESIESFRSFMQSDWRYSGRLSWPSPLLLNPNMCEMCITYIFSSCRYIVILRRSIHSTENCPVSPRGRVCVNFILISQKFITYLLAGWLALSRALISEERLFLTTIIRSILFPIDVRHSLLANNYVVASAHQPTARAFPVIIIPFSSRSSHSTNTCLENVQIIRILLVSTPIVNFC